MRKASKRERRLSGSEPKSVFALSLVLMALSNRLLYGLGRLLSQGRFHHDLSLPIDALFPFLPWTIVIYFGCLIFWAAVYYIVSLLPRRVSDRFFLAILLGKGVCCLFYILLPTTLVRPEVTGTTVWDELTRLLYRIDAPDNLFPSLHCLLAWLCWVGIRGNRQVSVLWRGAALVMAAAVCLSTLTMRQHVLLDAAGGVLLGEVCWLLAGADRLRRGYAAFIDRLLALTEKDAG